MKRQAFVATLLAGVVIVLVALNSLRFFTRIDITRHRENSISRVSRELFTEIEETVSITYVLSDRLRSRAYQPQQIIDLLNEYTAYARGRIRLEVVDPVEAGITGEIEQLGIVPQQIQVIEQDQQSLAVVYTGIIIRHLDTYKTLPVVFDPGSIEYQVTAAITEMIRERPRRVGVLPAAEGSTIDNSFRLLSQSLSRRFDLRILSPGDDVPPDIGALIVLGGNRLTSADLETIDAYLNAGGSALFAVDGVFVDFERELEARPLEDAPVLELLEHYGFTVQPQLVLNRANLRIPMQQQMGGFAIQTLEPYAHWIQIPAAAVNRSHPITARFAGLDLYWASPVVYTGDPSLLVDEARAVASSRAARGASGATDTPRVYRLVESAPDSWLMRDTFYTNPGERFLFEADFAATRGTYDLAYAYVGPLRPWSSASAAVAGATADARLVVIGDSDFATDLTRFSGSEHNLEFVTNVVEWLTNDEDLLSIRTRTARDVRLNRISEPELFSRRARLAEVLNVFVMPMVVVAVGVIYNARRRRAARGGGRS